MGSTRTINQSELAMTDKIKNLLQFIEYLHSNIDNFKKYNSTMSEINLLRAEQSKLRPREYIPDRIEYDRLQSDIVDKAEIISENIINPTKSKAIELGIYIPIQGIIGGRWAISEADVMQGGFGLDDVPIMLKYKTMYIEYRTCTNENYFQNLFFADLDRELAEIFKQFDKGAVREFSEVPIIQLSPIQFPELVTIQRDNNDTQTADPNQGKNTTTKVGTVIFSEQTVSDIIAVLGDKVDNVDNLRFLLKGNDIVVNFIGQRNQLADLFKRINKDRIYQDTVLSRWVTANFTANGAELRYNTIYDVIRGQTEVTKNKRIGLDIFPI